METTPAHEAIFSAIKNPHAGNLRICAVAGSGKTTTLVRSLKLITADKRIVFLAFNKKIATELQTRVPPHCKAQTLNSLGHGAYMGWMRTAGLDPKKLNVDSDKVWKLAKAECVASSIAEAVTRVVRLAKSAGIAPVLPRGPRAIEDVRAILPDTDEVWTSFIDHHGIELPTKNGMDDGEEMDMGTFLRHARSVLAASFADRKTIDFDDQLYMSVLLRAPVSRYDWVFVDESQDLSPLQHELVARAAGRNGRIVAVGDEHQAIYGFRGADANSLDVMAERFNMTDLPLHVSYRCPKAVIREAQEFVPHITSHASAPEGVVDGKKEVPDLIETDVGAGDMVVCRFTAPLVTARLLLLRRGIPAIVLGQNGAAGLRTLIKKLAPRDVTHLRALLDAWENHEKSKALAKGNDTKAASIEDKAETLRVFLNGADSLDALGSVITASFGEDGTNRVTLCTIHRAKGLEAERVFIVNDDTPVRFARQQWQKQQERNLKYVARTRAKHRLVYCTVPRTAPTEVTQVVVAAAAPVVVHPTKRGKVRTGCTNVMANGQSCRGWTNHPGAMRPWKCTKCVAAGVEHADA